MPPLRQVKNLISRFFLISIKADVWFFGILDTRMKKPLSIVSLLIAWLCAQGVLWDVVQVAAWGKMFHGYVQTESVRDSLRLTFDPDLPCGLCEMVRVAKETPDSNLPFPEEMERGDTRLILALPSIPRWIPPPVPGESFGFFHQSCIRRNITVEPPPPRMG